MQRGLLLHPIELIISKQSIILCFSCLKATDGGVNMDLILKVLSMMGHVIVESFSSPLFLILYLLLFIIISWQYKRVEKVSATIISTKRQVYIKSALISAGLGLLGGLLGSLLLVFIGIDLQSVGILHLWVIAIILMLISPRYLCFAYAGGILAMISLFFGYPQISIPQLMALIAILHMIESLLIILNGHFNPIPVYVKEGKQIRGGFNLQKFWPIPLVALIGAGVADPTSGVMMPEWWPLLKDYGGFAEGRTYTLLPVLAILGYGEISTTCSPDEKARKSALHLFVFSITLLGLSLLASNWDIFLPIVALFSPLGHELVIWLGMKEERSKQPKYVKPAQGLGILAIETPTLASRMGLKSGDIIMSINGKAVARKNQLLEEIDRAYSVALEIKRDNKIIKLTSKNNFDNELGIIFVPDEESRKYLTIKQDRLLDFWEKVKR